MLACVVALMLAATPVYVGGVPSKDGFVDVDKETADSIKDLRAAVRNDRTLSLVDSEAAAKVRIYVVARRTWVTGEGVAGAVTTTGNTTTGYGYTVPRTTSFLEVEVRAGSQRRSMYGNGGSWKARAKDAAKNASAWIDANRERIQAVP
jgi:hypothetical protein